MDFDNLVKKYNFNTGDILLYQHVNTYEGFSSYLFNLIDSGIKYFTKSKYTHVAMIIKNPPWNDELKGLYILESNMETIPDVEDNKLKCGVELIPLEKALECKSNIYYLRKLHCRRNYSFYNKLIDAHSLVYNKSYDLIITDWLKAILKINIGDVRRTNTFWCSALVSYLYCKLGFVRKDIPWTIISPKDLGTENPKESLEFINCVVDKEIKLETLIKK
tara:strand:+ start:235 stop:891 length:657 start_codon:yes stop_codon:yes gene_type:complete